MDGEEAECYEGRNTEGAGLNPLGNASPGRGAEVFAHQPRHWGCSSFMALCFEATLGRRTFLV